MSILDKLKGKEEKPKEIAKEKAPTMEEKPQAARKPQAVSKKKNNKKIVGVLVKPLVTEKAAFIGQYGQYIFEVSCKANKIEIAKAIESIYGVRPISINIIRTRGKQVRYGKTLGQTKKRKKAVITLKPGEKIEIHEGV